MIYKFEKDHIHNWISAEKYFDDDECKKIIEYGNSLKKENAKILDEEYNKDNKTRKNKIAWITYNEDSAWIFQKLSHSIKILNEQCFKFDISGIEDLQFTEYDAPDNHFSAHIDRSFGTNVIKISISIQLSDPQEYEGGELIIFENDIDGTVMTKEKGAFIAFPSFMMHKVNPITKGKRYSLVVWVTGSNFK
jgi:PKHD-type hydroxylase